MGGVAATPLVRRAAAALLATAVFFTACGGSGALSDRQKDWCRFTGDSESDAQRFDLIFEAGIGLGLDMDLVNARAGGLRDEFEAAGMSPDDAVRAVSDQLLENEDFMAACRAAYAEYGPPGGE